MKLLIDGRFIRTGHHDGISRYSASLIRELHGKVDFKVMINDLRQLRHLPDGTDYVLECAPTSMRELGLARRLNKLGISILYSPMQTTSTLGAQFKVILTLHDLIYYRHRKPPSEFNFMVQMLWRIYHLTFWPARFLLSRADGLVTISETTRRLINVHRLFKGKVGIVPNASDVPFPETQPQNDGSRIVTYMGSFMPYKDVETLVRAVSETDFELHLLSSITENRQTNLQRLADQMQSKVIFHNGVSDNEYLDVLDKSFAFVTASRDEGFGIPVIESMTRGIPVVCSDIPIFREVGANAARYFETGKPESLRAELNELMNQWHETSKVSIENSKRFNWKISADSLLSFIKEIERSGN